jgi:HEAT repeat protein
LLPRRVEARLDGREIEAIVAHELAHIRRGDLWVNWAQLLLRAVWWFHPVVWLVNRALRRVREDCCDDMLLACGIVSSEEYCDALVRAARELSAHRPVASALGCAETLHALGRRVVRLMDGQISRKAELSKASLMGTVVIALLVLPGLRSQEAPLANEHKPTPAPVAAAMVLPSHSVTTNQAPSFEELFAKVKWFREDHWAGDPELVASETAVREMGPRAIPFLIAKLKKPETESDTSVDQRRRAAWALGQFGPDGKEAIPALIEALQDQGDRVRVPDGHYVSAERVCTIAAIVLGNMGPAGREAIPALTASIDQRVGSALVALAKLAPESPYTLAVLTEAVQDDSHDSRSHDTIFAPEALRGLALVAEVQSEAVESIGLALRNPRLCAQAVRLLIANKRFSVAAAAVADRGWKEGSISDRSEVAAALSLTGRKSPELLAVMLQRLKEDEGGLSPEFVWGLGEYGPQAKPAIPALLKDCGRSENRQLENGRICALVRIESGDEEAGGLLEPHLLEAVHSSDWAVRSSALTALGEVRVNPKKGIPALLEALEDPSHPICSAALTGLAEYGAAAREAVPRIVALLEGNNTSIAAQAATALGRLGTNAVSAIPALIKVLDVPAFDLRLNTVAALGSFGPAARPAIPALEKLLQHSTSLVRENAAFSLWEIDGRTDVVPMLIQKLEGKTALESIETGISPQRRRSSILHKLGKIGPPAKAAVPLLEKMLENADPSLHNEIQQALERIERINPPGKPKA